MKVKVIEVIAHKCEYCMEYLTEKSTPLGDYELIKLTHPYDSICVCHAEIAYRLREDTKPTQLVELELPPWNPPKEHIHTPGSVAYTSNPLQYDCTTCGQRYSDK